MALRPGLVERFKEILPYMSELKKDLTYIENEFDPNNASEEERSQVKHLQAMANRPFDETFWRLQRLFAKKIIASGKLEQDDMGYYGIAKTCICFASGEFCEAYLPYWGTELDEGNPLYTWVPTSIEFDNKKNDYYFTAEPDISPAGVLVRVRE